MVILLVTIEDNFINKEDLYNILSKHIACTIVDNEQKTVEILYNLLESNLVHRLICLNAIKERADISDTINTICNYITAPESSVKLLLISKPSKELLEGFKKNWKRQSEKLVTEKNLQEVLLEIGFSSLNFIDDLKVSHPGERSFTKLDINPIKSSAQASPPQPFAEIKHQTKGDGYFRSVQALPGYHLEVTMETGSVIRFDFGSRLHTARFGRLSDEELFQSVKTDGNYLIFYKAGLMPVKVTASEFMDLVFIDRSK